MKSNSIFRNRKFKYGSLAIVFTVVFIAAIIALNVVFSALANTFLWYVDMTDEQLYGITDTTRELLSDVTDKQVKIIFCAPYDTLESKLETKLVLYAAQDYEKNFDWISVEYLDIYTNPETVKKYKTTAATSITNNNVVIECGDQFRLFAIEAFYTFSDSTGAVFAFNGEYKMTSAILSLTSINPIAYFTTGHGESVSSNALNQIFSDAGFDVRVIDLSKEDIDPEAKVIIINNPVYDFIGEKKGEVNEIKKIDDYLDNFGNLMVFKSPNSQKMPELEELLEEWGIRFKDSVIKDFGNCVSTDGFSLVADYPTEGLGASLHKSIRGLESTPKTIVRYASPIEILWTGRDTKNVSEVLTTFDGAEEYSIDGGDKLSTGRFNLMTLSCEERYINNEPYYTYVLVAGTSDFNDSAYIDSTSYGNKDILYAMMKAMGREKVPADIDFKVFDDKSLDITTSQANTWTVVLTAVVPSIIFICGVVVWARRRHL